MRNMTSLLAVATFLVLARPASADVIHTFEVIIEEDGG